ncbi:hypothetical protein [Leptothoe kymatousa]|uniref:hypothetical protein n=1 Tax=Leptothoe kymatousa TaxID=2651727 RepID=UPI002DD6A7BB|nr:hypothetical protein [Leptothoe kymatousa]
MTRTQCSHCDYLMIVNQTTGKVLEAYPGNQTTGKVLGAYPGNQSPLALTLQVNEKSSSNDKIAAELATLCKALNAYHIAHGGNGLEVEDWETLVAVRELVGV